ncbi:MAG: ABC transporter substrate-binding protein, partial [Deltaproteobacteria bacterium]|nr:ABC transporter substrate-binding protein [Deltaproteobacteria bacterium]
VEVILTSGASATRSAAAASLDIPIVFIYAGDPALAGFGQGPNATNMNITGVAALAREKMEIRLALLKEIIPALRTLHIFFDWNNRYSRDNFARVENVTKKNGLQALGHPIKSIEELNATIEGFDSERGDAIFQIPDDLIESAAQRIFNLARKKKIPTMFNEEVYAIKGALAAYGPNYRQMGRQAAQLVVNILSGRKPDSIPIEQASKFDLTLNYRTASFIGINLTQEIIDKADKVIR